MPLKFTLLQVPVPTPVSCGDKHHPCCQALTQHSPLHLCICSTAAAAGHLPVALPAKPTCAVSLLLPDASGTLSPIPAGLHAVFLCSNPPCLCPPLCLCCGSLLPAPSAAAAVPCCRCLLLLLGPCARPGCGRPASDHCCSTAPASDGPAATRDGPATSTDRCGCTAHDGPTASDYRCCTAHDGPTGTNIRGCSPYICCCRSHIRRCCRPHICGSWCCRPEGQGEAWPVNVGMAARIEGRQSHAAAVGFPKFAHRTAPTAATV